ncbi:probable LRR receptor-like serine/threonine-protein kinase At3g47570 [Cynara cardunculus var. scolymus]|uniref:probable LRR receptor-like serine/threonine-protein kinase At3g47570 n=1 Tax=Cynara cardunculus var. scolymus TaxID=59895 RepID=UPI000D62408B|nr:probable LRR receptor-like serine/threonine-protein kinase At3g47570 [Cynara cardunculus var. scolymus]
MWLMLLIIYTIVVAYALDYLHYRCGVRRDLKPSNILLDANMVAHVGDFGLAKIFSLELSDANKSSSGHVRGTIGYAPPKYGLGNEVSPSGDIYSYGILLLEMLTGKKPVDSMFREGLSLHSHATSALAGDFVLQIADPMLLRDDVKEGSLISLLEIGVRCSSEYPQD